jgi:Co/Zn/Cd efflux system component
MRSAWICTRNDVLGNLAVLLAAVGVFGTGAGWPDVTVAVVMAMLALQGAATVIRQAKSELRSVGHRVTPDPLRIGDLRHAGSPVASAEKHR